MMASGGNSVGGTERFDHTTQWRVSWVDKHGAVYESQWFSDGEQAEEKYLSLCESPRIKRVVMHEKKKVRQYDRKLHTGSDRKRAGNSTRNKEDTPDVE